MLIDTHCHLYFDRFDADRDSVVGRMQQAGVAGAVVIGIDRASTQQACELAARYPQLRYSAGLHPTSTFDRRWFAGGTFDAAGYLQQWLDGPLPPVAIGECGIDLHWDVNPLGLQQQAFGAQLELARGLGLPCVVHTRDADAETLEVLQSVPGAAVVLHCFNGSPELLGYALQQAQSGNWYVSFAGNLTFPRAAELRDTARQVPLQQLLVETDAPFLAPQPVRGKRCEPAHCAHTAAELAALKGLGLAEMCELLGANAQRCFNTSWDLPGA